MGCRRRVRDLLSAGLLLLALGAVAGAAWLTRHPEWPGLVRAAGWPVVGPLAARFRAAYLPAPAPQQPPGGGEPPRWIVVWEEDAPEPAPPSPLPPPEPPAPRPIPVGEVWVRPGSPLRERPDAAAEAVERTASWVLLPVVERRDGWAAVLRGGRPLWLADAALSGPEERPLGSEPLPPGPVAPAPPDPALLAEARRLLGPEAWEARLGPYVLLSDLPTREPVASLAAAVEMAEGAYRARTGLAPAAAAGGTIVLFAREASYRELQAGEEGIAGLPASGHALGAFVALFAGGQGGDETASVLLHELAHLLNQRAIGPALPPWLDEGLAEDLAGSARDAAGRPLPGTYGGLLRREKERWSATGGSAALAEAARALERAPGPLLPGLLELDRDRFLGGEPPGVSYALAFLFVRFLFEGEGGALAPAFRAFLADVAAGAPATAAALGARLDRGWPAVEAAWRAFVAAERLRVLGDAYGAPPAGRRRSSSRQAAEPSA